MRLLKRLGRSVVCGILERQVRALRRKNNFRVVAVVGSVGKTSTKFAIAQLLKASLRVQSQDGNYNDRVTVPLVLFGHQQPSLFNVVAWMRVFWQNQRMLFRPYPYDVVVLELGTDGPGFIKEFAYLRPDLAVVTAIAPEHMEFFGTLDAVAKEELTVLDWSKRVLINIDDTPKEYLPQRQFLSYGFSGQATYQLRTREGQGLAPQKLTMQLGEERSLAAEVQLLGVHGAKIALAAAASAHMLQVPVSGIKQGLVNVRPFAGRMQILQGTNQAVIIDDTYNASPTSAKAALEVLYGAKAPQRIAILGSMNELGDHSPDAHREVGEYCDPGKLDLVITIGADAQRYLAPAAKEKGCVVHMFDSPYDAGDFARRQLSPGAVVLAKGSQNRVFAEEAVKPLLKSTADQQKLVRQSPYWMRIKAKQFGH